MSIINFTTPEGKTYKKIVRLTGFNIGGTEYKCTTALRMQNATIETPIYSSASMRVIIRAAFPSGASGYLFGDSRFNIQVDSNNLKFMHDGTISTTKEIEPNRIYEFGFIDGIPFFQGKLEEGISTLTTGTEKCLIGGAVGKTSITNLILYRIDVYGHYNTTSDKKEAYAYYPCKQGTTAYMVEKWSNSLVTINGTASIYSPDEEEVAYGIEINEVRSLIGSGRHSLVELIHEDKSPAYAYNNADVASVTKNGELLKLESAFRLKNRPMPEGFKVTSSYENNTFIEDGELLQSRNPKWHLWADNINIGKKIKGTTHDDNQDLLYEQQDEGFHEAVDAKYFQAGYIAVNILHDDDKRVHLEDFEGYCHELFHNPAISINGKETYDFREIKTQEEGGATLEYPTLTTAFYSNFPMGGTGVGERQAVTNDGYPLYKLQPGTVLYDDISKYSDNILITDEFIFTDQYYYDAEGKLSNSYYVRKVKNGVSLGVPEIERAEYRRGDSGDFVGSVKMTDVIPYYFSNEDGIAYKNVVNTPMMKSTRTVWNGNEEVNYGNGLVMTHPVKVNVLTYKETSGVDIKFKIGNIVNWHLEDTYAGKDAKGIYCALRLTSPIGILQEDGKWDQNQYGVPLMLGYKMSKNNSGDAVVLGSQTSDSIRNEMIEEGVQVSDVINYLPNAIKANFTQWNMYGGNFHSYVDMGLLKGDFTLNEANLLSFSEKVYTARRLFRQNYVNLRYGIYNDSNIIIKGLDNTYTIDGVTYEVKVIGKNNSNDFIDDPMILHQNKSITLLVGVFNKETGFIVKGKAVTANLTIYHEERTQGIMWSEIASVDYSSVGAVSKTAISFANTSGKKDGFVSMYGRTSASDQYSTFDGSQGYLYSYTSLGGRESQVRLVAEKTANLFDAGSTDADTKIALVWTCSDFENYADYNKIVKDVTPTTNKDELEELEKIPEYKRTEDQYKENEPLVFQPNCTYVIEVTGIVSMS